MKTQSIETMIAAGATREEAQAATALWEFLRPGLRVKLNGRINTMHGDYNPLGLYRCINRVIVEGGR